MPATRKRAKPGKRTVPRAAAQRVEGKLTDAQETFVLAYLANGYNGTEAYRTAHPGCADGTAASEAWRYLRLPKIATRIEAVQTARWKRLLMQGDEALALLSLNARADIRQFVDDRGDLLPAKDWPVGAGLLVKSLKPGPFGTGITLHDAMRARELLAMEAGHLKANVNVAHTFDHVGHLAGKTPDAEKPGDAEDE